LSPREHLSAFAVRRVRLPPEPRDGLRVLVDRLWPRGLSRERAALERWMPEIGPSSELRRWFGHRPERWEEFRRRYRAELEGAPELVAELVRMGEQGRVTLLFDARDEARNQAVVLADYLAGARPSARRTRSSKGSSSSARKKGP